MALIECKYVVLHMPLFLAGTNLSDKLDPKKRQGLKLEWDNEENELMVSYAKEVAHVSHSSVAYRVQGSPEKLIGAVHAGGKPITAQVSTPHDHVFANAPGKTK